MQKKAGADMKVNNHKKPTDRCFLPDNLNDLPQSGTPAHGTLKICWDCRYLGLSRVRDKGRFFCRFTGEGARPENTACKFLEVR